jgi:hypothetical protein
VGEGTLLDKALIVSTPVSVVGVSIVLTVSKVLTEESVNQIFFIIDPPI